MNNKYTLLEETKQEVGHTLHRTQALQDIRVCAKAGELGGWIENESNLSKKGDAWVAGDALVLRKRARQGVRRPSN
jgi:hypothetical protein